ncbi:hypothetical protein AVEN_138887-1 [Araneus ventricosus]|uniref:RNase H type-1 domain-containing protein n=1 Tax=Araneus ventricosus TaxID=182803 RepID=A0A4Y2TU71_ARAVE|nr:hypothetical protein AVEN_138887-1 [Araneus ventricosus]
MIGEDPQKFSESRVMRTIAIGRLPIRNLPKNFNSVFQSELAAIHRAAIWAAEKNSTINIRTDSLSSIAALRRASARSGFVNNIKKDLFQLKHLVGLSRVKAHIGIQGNELAYQQAKSATTTGVDKDIPAPRSFIKRTLNIYMFNEWNEYWRQYDSASGARVREYLPGASPKFLIHNKFLIFFLSGHGPFPQYLCRFKFLDTLCASVGRWAMQTTTPFAARSRKNFIYLNTQAPTKRLGCKI